MGTDLAGRLAPQIDWIRRLVAHDTTSRLSNQRLIEDVEAYVQGLGIATTRVPDPIQPKTNLFFTVGPMVEGGVVLSGHSDVVPVDGQEWTSDPFAAEIRDDRLYGRGTADMKGFLGIALSLVPEMIAADLRHPVHFAISYDEEDGLVGAPPLIEELRHAIPAPAAVIVGEPTRMAIVEGHKGIIAFRTTVTGHEAHSSQPQLGQSAIMAAAGLMQRIADLADRLAATPDPASDFVPPYSTISIGIVSGGTAPNILARQCSFIWDVRAVSADEQRAIVSEVLAAAEALDARIRARFPDCGVQCEQLVDAPPLAPDQGNAAVAFLQNITGVNATEVAGYAAEAGMFQQAGFPTAICGPGSIDQAHQPDEYIELDQIAAGLAMQRRLIAHLAGRR